MVRFLVCFWMFLGVSLAQTEKPALNDVFKKEATGLSNDVDKVLSTAIPNRGPFQGGAKATYLDGYGIVVTVETALEPPRGIFGASRTVAELQKAMNQHLSDLEQGLQDLLKERSSKLQSVGDSESVSIVVYISNFNTDVPNVPSQVVFTTKKEDPGHVTTRTFF
jgi:hypothetical protein